MNKISIKKRLLTYFLIIQTFVLIVFATTIYMTFKLTTIDKLKSNLKVVILDIKDDLFEHDIDLRSVFLDEEDEYKITNLYIALYESSDNNIELINTNHKDKKIIINNEYLKNLEENIITFDLKDESVFAFLKSRYNNKEYIIVLKDNDSSIDKTLKNILYILIFVTPLIIILSLLGGNFLISKSFKPIKELLLTIKSIDEKKLSTRVVQTNSNDEIDSLTIEINKLLDRVEEAYNKSLQFSSDASHELKTPLTIIKGEIEVALLKPRENQEYKNVLENVNDEVSNIKDIIDQLLFLSKTNNQLTKEKFSECYVDEILEEVCLNLKLLASKKNITIDLNIKEFFAVLAQEMLFKIMIKNLIVNAINYSYENSKVDVIVDKNVLIIQDYGIGIAKAEQKLIFEKFYRTDKSRDKNSGGSGLGLAIVKRVCELHGFKISIDSIEGKSTKITLKF